MNHLSCPFCGHEPELRIVDGWYRITCDVCALIHGYSNSSDEAWRLWDQRSETELIRKLRALIVSMNAESHEGKGEYWDGYDQCKDNAAWRIGEILNEFSKSD